jgi:protein disulfide-isomerase
MRLLPIPLLYTLFASVAIAQSAEKAITEPAGESSDDAAAEGPAPTTFNGISVPPIPDINGEKFNSTIKEGHWFVKHHS